ncbi:hypothetical protein NPIL_437481 [Nephila pilipes]|uniref:Uncharacterized protein n=1 Tax=Nephila pilipes TaxID=299642 RepID=A0A8X6PSF7_NEPPI|nr:hypothetical protein NPIL_437481 [Nephila pilipes]
MVVLVILEVGYYLLLNAFAVLLQGDLPSLIQIIGFVTVNELVRLYFIHNFAKTTFVPMTNDDEKLIPNVQPVTVVKFCQALDVDVQLPPTDKQNGYIKNNSFPIVQSIHVYKMCVALGLDAQLSDTKKQQPFVSKLQKQRAAKIPPIVLSPFVFKICEALGLPATLASP